MTTEPAAPTPARPHPGEVTPPPALPAPPAFPAGALVEHVGEAAVMSLANGVIVSWNTAAEELYGWPAADAVGRDVDDLVPLEHRAADAELRRRALAGERLTGVPLVRHHRDGHVLHLMGELFPLPAGAVPPDPAGAGATGSPDTSAGSVPVEVVDELLALMPGIAFAVGPDGRLTFSAGGGLSRVGLAPGDAVGLHLRDFASDPVAAALVDEVLAGRRYQGPLSLVGGMWEVFCGPVHRDGQHIGTAGLALPSDEAWSQVESSARREARFEALVRNSSDLVLVVDRWARIAYVSPSGERLLGWPGEGSIGRSVLDFVEDESRADVERLIEAVRADALAGEGRRAGHTVTVRVRHADGGWRHYELVTSDYQHDPAIGGFVVNGRDVTERQQAEARLRHASLHDPLTGLPNRAKLIDDVTGTLAGAGDNARVAVVVVGLDGFKLVNDSLGHAIGDELLLAVARRLRHQVRMGDTVARMGGDTFVVTTTGVVGAEDARRMAQRLLGAVAEPYDLQGRRITVTAGAGVALSGSGDDATALVRNADTAMYAAKRRGRNRVEVFEPKLRADATRQMALEQSLGRAVGENQLRVHFQPIMALTGRSGHPVVSGVEALVRWEHPELGLIPPFDFIPLAETTGHIVDIGAWVLRESCRTLMAWAGDEPPLRLAVNLSPRQLIEPGLPDVVADVLRETRFPVDRLTMEVTESVLVDEGPYATTTLRRLRELGVSLSIDDFGTGYSSLVYLRRLNADALKIDRSFVDGLGRDSEADAIVNTVIGLARSLGLDLVAEGVETEEQRRLLVELGCQFAQGYLFSRPLPAGDFQEWRETVGGLTVVSQASQASQA